MTGSDEYGGSLMGGGGSGGWFGGASVPVSKDTANLLGWIGIGYGLLKANDWLEEKRREDEATEAADFERIIGCPVDNERRIKAGLPPLSKKERSSVLRTYRKQQKRLAQALKNWMTQAREQAVGEITAEIRDARDSRGMAQISEAELRTMALEQAERVASRADEILNDSVIIAQFEEMAREQKKAVMEALSNPVSHSRFKWGQS